MPIRKYLITLTDAEIEICRQATITRLERINQNGYKHREPATQDDKTNFHNNYRGIVTELAAAKYFDESYEPDKTCDRSRNDLLNGCEVRSLQAKYSWGCMIVHEWDKPAPYVLVSLTDNANEFLVVGWRDLVDCRLKKYWRTDVPAPAYFVPQADLHDMATLKEKFAA